MDRFTTSSRYPRISVVRRANRLVATVWITASLALPLAGAAAVATTLAQQAANANAVTYTIQRGDTLGGIAIRFGVSVDELVQANGLADPNRIYVGQTLVIPGRQAPSPSGAGQKYIIQVGDTLSTIARRYGVSVDDLVAANGLPSRDSITAGQLIVIPGVTQAPAAPPVDAIYTLQRGDSLYRVSLIFDVSVDDLLAANSLATPNSVYAGLVIRIPTPGQPDVAANANPPSPEAATGGRTVIVGPGDTLTRIAINNGVTVDGLIAANGINNPDRLYIGQVLNMPDAGAAARPYPAQTAVTAIVKAGDTLSSIALRFGVTVHALAVANSIADIATIYSGQVLTIPAAQAGSNSVRYASMGPGLCPAVDSTQSGTGFFIRPTVGYVITQRFLPWHSGIDLAANIGTQVFASDGGTVVFAGWNPAGYGNLIVLDHGNGWRTYYGHLSEVDVACGNWVPRGSIIGKVGSTGNSTGPHLHFEMLRFGIAVNPAGYIRF